MKVRVTPNSLGLFFSLRSGLLVLCVGAAMAAHSPAVLAAAGTTTTVTLTSEGSPASSVDLHTVVTLTAKVKAGATTLKLGQVKFCDAKTSCQDIHLKGLSQITAAGTATLNFVAGPGTHSYTAVFAGTQSHTSSESGQVALEVTSRDNTLRYPSTTTLSAAGSAGSYTLTARVAGLGAGPGISPAGDVLFLDTSHSNYKLGKARLPATSPSLDWIKSSFHKTAQITNTDWENTVTATGDFNGDGHADLVVFDSSIPSLNVLLGDGRGHLTSASKTTLPGQMTFGMAVGDFNNDGKLDLALSTGASRLVVLSGNGDGTFTRKDEDDLKGAVRTAADFNHDGNMDVLVRHSNGSLALLRGKGDGTFIEGPSFGTEFGYNPTYLIGDFDGDGNFDLGQYSFGGDNDFFALDVQYGNGDGTFTAAVQTVVDGNDPYPAVEDLNGDARTDLVFTPYRGTSLVLLGNKDRTFSEKSFSPTPNAGPLDVYARAVAGDFNGDGIVDAAFAFNSATQAIEVALGKGDSTFSTPSTVPYTAYFPDPSIQVAADFNEDGVSDFAAFAIPAAVQPGYGVLLTEATATVQVSGLPPQGSGAHEVVARYYISDNDYDGSISKPLNLSGLTSAAPVATLSTLALPFPDQAVGERSNGMTVLLQNTGTDALAISSFKLAPVSGPGLSFSTSNNCPASLAPNASCMLRFRFYPGSAGAKTSQLVITDNAGNSPQVITLTGTGVTDPE